MRLLLLFGVLISIECSAQLGKINPYVITFNGEKFDGQQLSYDSPIMKPSHFKVDGNVFNAADVAFFQNNHGYFANLAKLYSDNSERYAIRIRSGILHLYEEINIDAYAQEELQITENSSSMENEMLATWEYFQYYTKNNGPVKKANYKNLKADLSDNPLSAHSMKNYRNYRILQVAMVLAGAGLVSMDIARQSNQAVQFTPWMATGIVIGGSSYFLESAKENEKWLAVDSYNKGNSMDTLTQY
ncbi:MAG: hypothetical protein IT223_01960 [Crocinitomicaceae bacterium]|nr:hypothetical protein [Crocinitomicaceae bacterium]